MARQVSLGNLEPAGAEHKPERRDAAANRALILATAERLFAERGIANVHMAEIAQAAGVGKGTLYRRFASKAQVCLALMDTQMAEFQNDMLAHLMQLSADDVPRLEQLDRFLDALVYFTDKHAPLLCEVQREGLIEYDGTLQRPHFWQYMTVSGLLKAAVNRGELSVQLDTEYLADAILAPLRADMFRFQTEVRGFTLERISAGLRLLVHALRNA